MVLSLALVELMRSSLVETSSGRAAKPGQDIHQLIDAAFDLHRTGLRRSVAEGTDSEAFGIADLDHRRFGAAQFADDLDQLRLRLRGGVGDEQSFFAVASSAGPS